MNRVVADERTVNLNRAYGRSPLQIYMDELLKKFLDGEVSEEQYNTSVGALSPEDKKKHDELLSKPETQAQLKKKAEEVLGQIGARRKELGRIEQPPKPPETVDYAKKLREENLGKAKGRFFSDFNIPAEQQAEYATAFEQSGNQDVSEEYIYEALTDIYTRKNKKSLLDKAKERDKMVEGAEDFNANQGGAPGGGSAGSGDGEKRKDPKVLEWIREMEKSGRKISYEDAERVLTRGLTRRFE